MAQAIKNALRSLANGHKQGPGQFEIGNGSTMFPDNPNLDESSWAIVWFGTDEQPIAVNAQHGHDFDTILEFTLQEAIEEPAKVEQMIADAVTKSAV